MTMSFENATPEDLTERLITRAYAMVADAERLIAEQREKIRQLETLSFSDPLTSLLNRRGFEAAVNRELAAAARAPAAGVTLVLIDLDGFKKVNDTHGHPAGDAYLCAVANYLRANCRPADLVARLGGDEFAVLLTRTRRSSGQKRAASLLAGLNSASFQWEEHLLSLKASYGAAASQEVDKFSALMNSADTRLYANKQLRQKVNA